MQQEFLYWNRQTIGPPYVTKDVALTQCSYDNKMVGRPMFYDVSTTGWKGRGWGFSFLSLQFVTVFYDGGIKTDGSVWMGIFCQSAYCSHHKQIKKIMGKLAELNSIWLVWDNVISDYSIGPNKHLFSLSQRERVEKSSPKMWDFCNILFDCHFL